MNSRNSVLLALSTGMIVGIVALPMLPKSMGPSPSPKSPVPTPLPAVVASPAPLAPAPLSPSAMVLARSACVASVDGFLSALSSGDREMYKEYLTPLAIAGIGPDEGLSIDGTGIEVYQVGEAEVIAGEATVPVAMTIRGQLQNMDLHLRQEPHGAWSIYGTSVKMGAQKMMINFEGGPNSLEVIAEDMLEEVADQLGEGMQEAMQELATGMAEGLAEGLAEGFAEGLSEGLSEGLTEELVEDQIEAPEGQQPEEEASALVPLEYGEEGPVSLRFVGIADRSDPQFTRVDVGVENHSNKAINKVQANFHYLDEAGEVLDFFPHSLAGPIGFGGQAPLAIVGGQKVNNVTAFFMPETTASVRIELLEVHFDDGSSWAAE